MSSGEKVKRLETFWSNLYLRGPMLFDPTGAIASNVYAQPETGLPFSRAFVIGPDKTVVLPIFGYDPDRLIDTIHELLLPLPTPGITDYGCGVNPPGSLTVLSGVPVLGQTLVLGLDAPDAAAPPLPATAILLLALAPDPNFPCGSPFPLAPLVGAGPSELLISLVPPNPTLALLATPWLGPGEPAQVALDIPLTPGMAGQRIYAQGALLQALPVAGVSLTGAVEILLAP